MHRLRSGEGLDAERALEVALAFISAYRRHHDSRDSRPPRPPRRATHPKTLPLVLVLTLTLTLMLTLNTRIPLSCYSPAPSQPPATAITMHRHRYGARRPWQFLRSSLVESPRLAISPSPLGPPPVLGLVLLGSHKAWLLPDTRLSTPAPSTAVLCFTPPWLLLRLVLDRPHAHPRPASAASFPPYALRWFMRLVWHTQSTSHALRQPTSQWSRAHLHCSPRRLRPLPQPSDPTTFTSPSSLH